MIYDAKTLDTMAGIVETQLKKGDYYTEKDVALFTFNTGASTVRFRCNSSEIPALISRLRSKRLRLPVRRSAGTKRRSSSLSPPSAAAARSTIDRFILEGELYNAAHYAQLTGVPIYLATSKGGITIALYKAKKLNDARFVLGQVSGDYVVTHLASGLHVVRHKSKEEALETYERRRKDTRFEQTLEMADCNFQSKIHELLDNTENGG